MTAQTRPSTRYIAPKGKFQTRYPSDWISHPGEDTLDLGPANDNSGIRREVSIDVPFIPPHLPGMITLDRIQKGYMDDLRKRYTDVKLISSVDRPFPEAKARLLEATARNAKIYTVLAMRHERVYIIASETDIAGAEAGKSVVQMILASWQWDNN